jgi:hypothetical protein
MPFGRKQRGAPEDYLVAASTRLADTMGEPAVREFAAVIRKAFSPFEPENSLEVALREGPSDFEGASFVVIAEALRLALESKDEAAVPAIVALGVTLAMRFEAFARGTLGEL